MTQAQSQSDNSEVSWRDVDLQETLNILRQARTDSSLSQEYRHAISQICFVADQMYPQILQRLEQQQGGSTSPTQSQAATASGGTQQTSGQQQDNSNQARTG